MDRIDHARGFHFNDDSLVDNEVSSEQTNRHASEDDFKGRFSSMAKTALLQGHRQRTSVYRFEKSGAKLVVHIEEDSDDVFSQPAMQEIRATNGRRSIRVHPR